MESLENFRSAEEKEEKIEIKPIGSFLETDEEGFLINPASIEKVQLEYEPVFDDIINLYKKRFGDALKNVYIRGSVAKGKAIEGVSDIDTFAFVDLPEEEIAKLEEVSDKELLEKYPFIAKIEMVAESVEKSHSHGNVIVLNQAICVYGDPIEVPKIKPDKHAMMHLHAMQGIVEKTNSFFESERSDERTKSKCGGVMKKLVRSGCELVMERSGKYTRDLYPSYEIFAEYYPEKSAEMLEALELALNPSADKEKIRHVINNLGVWLSEEYRRNYQESEVN